MYRSDDHLTNFLDCVKSRKACVAPAETAHRSITPGHLGYVSQKLGRAIQWDARREVIIDDEQADSLLKQQQNREPYTFG